MNSGAEMDALEKATVAYLRLTGSSREATNGIFDVRRSRYCRRAPKSQCESGG